MTQDRHSIARKIGTFIALLIAAAIGLRVGDIVGSQPRDALDYEYWATAEAYLYLSYYYGIAVGLFTCASTFLVSKALNTPEQWPIVVSLLCSPVIPVREVLVTGQDIFSGSGLLEVWGFNWPYVLGLLLFLGGVYVVKLVHSLIF